MMGRECPYCGDMLDPGEKCPCRDARIARGEVQPRRTPAKTKPADRQPAVRQTKTA